MEDKQHRDDKNKLRKEKDDVITSKESEIEDLKDSLVNREQRIHTLVKASEEKDKTIDIKVKEMCVVDAVVVGGGGGDGGGCGCGCLTSRYVSVSQGRFCSDNCTCCHTEIEVVCDCNGEEEEGSQENNSYDDDDDHDDDYDDNYDEDHDDDDNNSDDDNYVDDDGQLCNGAGGRN